MADSKTTQSGLFRAHKPEDFGLPDELGYILP